MWDTVGKGTKEEGCCLVMVWGRRQRWGFPARKTLAHTRTTLLLTTVSACGCYEPNHPAEVQACV